MPFDMELSFALEAADRASELVRREYDSFVAIPDAPVSISTHVDKASQDLILRFLHEQLPRRRTLCRGVDPRFRSGQEERFARLGRGPDRRHPRLRSKAGSVLGDDWPSGEWQAGRRRGGRAGAESSDLCPVRGWLLVARERRDRDPLPRVPTSAGRVRAGAKLGEDRPEHAAGGAPEARPRRRDLFGRRQARDGGARRGRRVSRIRTRPSTTGTSAPGMCS